MWSVSNPVRATAAKPSTVKPIPTMTPMNCAGLQGGVTDSVVRDQQITTRRHTITVKGPDTLSVRADPTRLRQVLNNLLPDRRCRTSPRVVKRAISKFAAHTASGRFHGPSYKATISIDVVDPDP